jgi:hypothetical protein
MVFHQHRCIHVHVPKTGGQSIRLLLEPGERNIDAFDCEGEGLGEKATHLFAWEMRDSDREGIWGEYFSFAFVRNPWDRVVSEYLWRERRSHIRIAYETFEAFLEALKTGWDYEMDDYRHVVMQSRFVCDEEGDVMVDFTGRFETLERDVEEVRRLLNLPKQALPKFNLSKQRGHYSVYYTPETRKMVGEMYAEDVERFGYRFESESG